MASASAASPGCRNVARLNERTDREEWGMTPQTVNAYYNPVFNEIVFPAAILQPPFFDPNADDAVNYGAIGGVIGHEMGHGFDDQGAKSDARGVLRDWWNADDVARFNALGDRLAEQYSAFSPLEGINVNGRLTLGENIGDVGGLQVAHKAYELASTPADRAREIEGISGDQRFFLAWGQVWKQAIRDQRLRNQVLSDPHSPAQYRINGVVRNLDAWYAAFSVQPGARLYLAPADRVQIW
jgi:predicted metalloendopeptidase